MKLTTKHIVSGALLIGGVYFIYKYFKKSKPSSIITPESATQPTTTIITATDSYPLKRGSKGDNVKNLQKLLLQINPKFLPKYGADGSFGAETEAAVMNMLNGKRTVDQKDIANLFNIYNKKAFPLVSAPSGETTPYDPFKIGK